MSIRDNVSSVLRTTQAALAAWSKTPLAQTQRKTVAVLEGIDLAAPDSLARAHESLVEIVAGRGDFPKRFVDDPSATLCLVAIDRALGGAPSQPVDRLVDQGFMEHGGDLVALADALLRGLRKFEGQFAVLLDEVPLSKSEGEFCQHAREHAEFEEHDRFANACVIAADYLADDLRDDREHLADRAFLAWLLQAFAVAHPTFSVDARARLLQGLTQTSPRADDAAIRDYLRWVVDGAGVEALEQHVLRTHHVGLLRAFVAESPQGYGQDAHALLAKLEVHGAATPTSEGRL